MKYVAITAVLMLAGTASADAARSKADPFAGRVATITRDCVRLFGDTHVTILDENTLLYRENGKRLWRNDLIGGCPGLDRDDILVLEPFGSQLCRSDRVRGIDRTVGFETSFCRLGSFTAYEKPPAR